MDLFQSCGHCWVFQICWHIECSTFTTSSFRIWNSSTAIPSHPLALFIVMLSKAHFTSYSRMSGSSSSKIHVIAAQSLSHVWLFAILWMATHQASLSFTITQRLLKLMSTESVMPSNHLILCHPLLLLSSIVPSIRVFSNELALCIRRQIGISASASVLPMNTQDWSPLGWTGLISLQSKGLSRVFSSTTVRKQQFFVTQPSLWSNSHIHTWLLEKP